MTYRLGVDVGGTFTDLLLVDEASGQHVDREGAEHAAGSVDRRADAASSGSASCAGISPKQIDHVMHGTTVATNTVLTGTGAQVRAGHDARLSAGAADRALASCRAASAAGSSTTRACRWRR